jgi:TolB-like protein
MRTNMRNSNVRSIRSTDWETSTGEDKIREYTAKILKSSQFVGAERMRRFLEFVVEGVLSGQSADLKEYVLGIEVFDRAAETFDPRIDPIVRVEARRLRSKLKAYYESEGRSDQLVIEIPSGSYVPRFRQGHNQALEAVQRLADRTVLIMPFTNLSRAIESFSDGLREEVVHALTGLPGVRVVASTKGESEVSMAGRKLELDSIISGSVRRSGGLMRVMVQAIDAKTGCYLWSETYDGAEGDAFRMQHEVSRAIAFKWRARFDKGADRTTRGVAV